MAKDNFNRKYIIDLLKIHKNLTISQIVEITELSRPTIYLHLDILEKEGFIKRDKDDIKKGKPVTISLIQNSVAQKDKKELLEFLKIVREKNPTSTELKTMGLNISPNVLMESSFNDLTEMRFNITNKGKQFLKEHTKPH
jgi:DNA-binding transcriptional ArsR family regulator